VGLHELGIQLERGAKPLLRLADAVAPQLGLTGQQPCLRGHVVVVRHPRQRIER